MMFFKTNLGICYKGYVAPCQTGKAIPSSLGFCIYLRCRFHIPRQQKLGNLNSKRLQGFRFLRLKSRFQSLGFRIPRAKISQIFEFGLPCTWGQIIMASNKELSLLWLYYNECGRRWSNEIKYRHLSKIVWTILYTVSKMPNEAIKLYTIVQKPLQCKQLFLSRFYF